MNMTLNFAKPLFCLLLGSVLLSACVTTIKGPDRKPASKAEMRDAYLELARGYLSKGIYEQARAPLKKALEKDSKSSEAYVMLGILNEGQTEFAVAEQDYKHALRLDAGNPMALSNYGRFLYSQKRNREAMKYLRKAAAVSGYTGRALAYQNLGLAEVNAGDLQAAEAAFRSCLALDSGKMVAAYELASLLFEKEEYATARRYYNNYVAKVRQSARSLWLGIRLARQFQETNRISSYELALEKLFPESPEYALLRENLN